MEPQANNNDFATKPKKISEANAGMEEASVDIIAQERAKLWHSRHETRALEMFEIIKKGLPDALMQCAIAGCRKVPVIALGGLELWYAPGSTKSCDFIAAPLKHFGKFRDPNSDPRMIAFQELGLRHDDDYLYLQNLIPKVLDYTEDYLNDELHLHTERKKGFLTDDNMNSWHANMSIGWFQPRVAPYTNLFITSNLNVILC